MIVALTGYPGSGKTSIAEKLAGVTGWPWLDTDQMIEEIYSKPPARIITEEGEKTFRWLESEVLRNILNEFRNKSLILSLGGGMILSPGNLELLRDETLLVFINTPFEKLLKRLEENPEGRPLLPTHDGKLDAEAVYKHYKGRLTYYLQAHLVFDNHFPDAESAARHLWEIIQTLDSYE